jgi:hypothetical protein
MVETIRGMDEHWKIILLILVPLVFRPLRNFLLNVEEAFGMKRTPSLGTPPAAKYMGDKASSPDQPSATHKNQ